MSKYIRLVIFILGLSMMLTCIHCSKGDDDGQPTPEFEALANTAWPMIGHDRQHSCRSPYIGPKTNRLEWSQERRSLISSPIAIDRQGNIIFGTYSQGLFCYKPDGELLWHYEDSSRIDSCPAIGWDGTVYAGIRSGQTLLALTPDGELKWSFNKGSGSCVASPAISKSGIIYVCDCGGALFAINPDGSMKWVFTATSGIFASPAVAPDGTIYFGSFDKYFYAVNPDGTLKWKFLAYGQIYAAASIGIDGTVFFCDRKILYALNPDGSEKWFFDLSSIDNELTYAPPAVGNDGTVYLSGADYFIALNPDGTLKWKADINFTSGFPLIAADGTIYVCGGNGLGSITALTPAGEEIWKYDVGQTQYGSPALGADGTLYIAGQHYNDGAYDEILYAFHD